MIYREARKLHNLIFYFRLPVVRCFVSWETRLLIFFHSFPVKSKDWTTTYFEQFKDRTHSLGTVKVSTSTVPKIITIPRLAARGSGSQARKIASPFLCHVDHFCRPSHLLASITATLQKYSLMRLTGTLCNSLMRHQ